MGQHISYSSWEIDTNFMPPYCLAKFPLIISALHENFPFLSFITTTLLFHTSYYISTSLSFCKYYITRSFRGSAPLLLAPVVGWEAIQAPRALQAPGPFRYCGGLWPPGPFRHCGSLWPHFHYNIIIFHIHYFIFMKIGRQFPNHPGGMSHGTLLFYTGASPGGLLSSA